MPLESNYEGWKRLSGSSAPSRSCALESNYEGWKL